MYNLSNKEFVLPILCPFLIWCLWQALEMPVNQNKHSCCFCDASIKHILTQWEIATYVLHIDVCLCAGLHEFDSKLQCELNQNERKLWKLQTPIDMLYPWFTNKSNQSMYCVNFNKLLTFSPLSLDTCRLSLMSHLLPRTIFSTSDDACLIERAYMY